MGKVLRFTMEIDESTLEGFVSTWEDTFHDMISEHMYDLDSEFDIGGDQWKELREISSKFYYNHSDMVANEIGAALDDCQDVIIDMIGDGDLIDDLETPSEIAQMFVEKNMPLLKKLSAQYAGSISKHKEQERKEEFERQLGILKDLAVKLGYTISKI